jgi:hypothetical protein
MSNTLRTPAANGDPNAGLNGLMYVGEPIVLSDPKPAESLSGGVTVLGPVNESDELDVPDYL